MLSHFSHVRLFANCSPPDCPWDSPGKNTGLGCHFLLQNKQINICKCLLKRGGASEAGPRWADARACSPAADGNGETGPTSTFSCSRLFFFFFILKLFWWGKFLKFCYNFASILCFDFSAQGTRVHLSSLDRDWTHPPALEGKVLATGQPGRPLSPPLLRVLPEVSVPQKQRRGTELPRSREGQPKMERGGLGAEGSIVAPAFPNFPGEHETKTTDINGSFKLSTLRSRPSPITFLLYI